MVKYEVRLDDEVIYRPRSLEVAKGIAFGDPEFIQKAGINIASLGSIQVFEIDENGTERELNPSRPFNPYDLSIHKNE